MLHSLPTAGMSYVLSPVVSVCVSSTIWYTQTAHQLQPQLTTARQAVSRIVQAVRNWGIDQNAPAKLIYVLHHEYTEAGLSFSGLKNRDRAVADALRQAAHEAELKVYLAIVTKNESGSAEGGRSYYKRRRWGYDYESEDPDDWSMCEVCDSDVTLGNWVGLNDEHKEFGEMNVDVEDEVLQEDDPFENLEPDHVEVEECSGNEGATMERWYHLAALVFWPCAKAINIEFEALLRSGYWSGTVKKLQSKYHKVCCWEYSCGIARVPQDDSTSCETP